MRQKNILIVLLLFVTTTFCVQAQFRVAMKAGANLSNLSMEMNGLELDIYTPRPGFHAGFMTEYMFSRRFGLESGLSYANKGAAIDPDKYYQGSELPDGLSMEGHVSMHTLQMPLYAKIKFGLSPGMQLYVMAGGFASYTSEAHQHVRLAMNGEYLKMKWSLFEPEIRVMDETEDNLYMQHRFNAGIALEAGLEIGKDVIVGLGFQQVINNMAAFGYSINGRTMKPDISMWSASLSLGYFL